MCNHFEKEMEIKNLILSEGVRVTHYYVVKRQQTVYSREEIEANNTKDKGK